MAERTLAYVSDGKVLLKAGADEPREIESPVLESAAEAVLESRRLESGRAHRDHAAPLGLEIAGLTRGRVPGELLYALYTSAVSGVFTFDASNNAEARLFHGADHRVQYLHARVGHDLVACNVSEEGGAASIAVMQADGSAITIVTEGDSLDAAPRWVPREDRKIVYQSAGVGRDAHGRHVGIGPYSIQRIDLRKGELETLAGDPARDLLGPQIAEDGALYYIRRPYVAPPPAASFADRLRSFFGGIFGRTRAPVKPMILWGSRVEAAVTESELDTPSVVPSSWELCRTNVGGDSVEVLAKGVVSFDLDDAGGLIFTNGRAIYARDASGKTERVCTAERIEQVALIA